MPEPPESSESGARDRPGGRRTGLTGYQRRSRRQVGAESDDFTVERYRQLGRHLDPSAGVVLDLGASTGAGGAPLAAACPMGSIVGLDVLPERLAVLPGSYTGGIGALVSELPFADRSVDAVVAAELLEHLAASDVDPVLCELQRVLRLGGRLVLTTPNPGYLRNRLTGASVLGRAHLTQHEARVLGFRLRMHGFRRIRVRGTGRVSRYLGTRFPARAVYGSYLMTADKW